MQGVRRVDIDEKKTQIIEWLESGVPRTEVCFRLQCRYSSLELRLRDWGMLHLKNQGRRGLANKESRKDITQFLVLDGPPIHTHALKLRLWREGLLEKACQLCGWAESTADGRIPLELDHTNGNRYDNRLENLRILCPNCHSLQDTSYGPTRSHKYEARQAPVAE